MREFVDASDFIFTINKNLDGTILLVLYPFDIPYCLT